MHMMKSLSSNLKTTSKDLKKTSIPALGISGSKSVACTGRLRVKFTCPEGILCVMDDGQHFFQALTNVRVQKILISTPKKVIRNSQLVVGGLNS